jgi:hypothetical protein
MSKDIRSKAQELLSFGIPKQAVFDTLRLEHPEVKPKKLAEAVRYLPTREARERYRTAQRLLLACIAASAVLRIARPMLAPDFEWTVNLRLLSLMPFATLMLAWSIYRWHGEAFGWVGWMNAAGGIELLRHLKHLAKDGVEPWSFANDALELAIGGLALYLSARVFAKYRRVKDPMGGDDQLVFPEDPMT